jgi:phage terminase large subunit
MKIKVPKPYRPLYNTEKSIILLTGGRGSAKSFNAATFAKRLTYEKNHKLLYTRYTMDSASKSIIPEFNEKIEMEHDGMYFSVNNTDITNIITGSQILFSGIKTSSGNQTAKLKSIQGLSTLVVDEAEEWVNGDEYETIKLSIRNNKVKNRVIIIMNPSTKNHWVYEKYIEGTKTFIEIEGVQIPISDHPEVEHIHTTYLDNIEHLSEEFLREVEYLKQNSQKTYRHKILGVWRNTSEGQILTRWQRGKFNDSLNYVFGLDWGWTDPFTLTKIAVDKKQKILYVKQIAYASNLSMPNILSVIQSNCKTDDLIVCDSSEPLNIDQLRQANYNAVKAYKRAGIVAERLRWLQEYLIIVDDSPDIEKELNSYIWSNKRAELPVDRDNHSIDGIGYAYTQLHLWGL